VASKIEAHRAKSAFTLTMPSYDPLFRDLLSEGWFVSVVDTDADRITVNCEMFSRDYDDETGYTDIVLGEPEPGMKLYSAAKFNGVFQLSQNGAAIELDQPVRESWHYKEMPRNMANAIAALITPENFPEAAESMRLVQEYPEQENARIAFWASVNQQVSSMTAAGDPWGALKVQREAVNKLLKWVDPPVEQEEESIPEPKLEDMTPPRYSLLDSVYDDQEDDDDESEEDDFLPVGSHLLPSDFQDFLRNWNQTIAASTGDWLGEPRQTYKAENPEQWQQFRSELKELSALYAEEVAAVKAYQATYEAQDA